MPRLAAEYRNRSGTLETVILSSSRLLQIWTTVVLWLTCAVLWKTVVRCEDNTQGLFTQVVHIKNLYMGSKIKRETRLFNVEYDITLV